MERLEQTDRGLRPAQTPASEAHPKTRVIITLTVLSLAAALLLTRLGHYALWDDEAITALTARAVWNTGDTSAVIGQNILAYRNGLLIRDMKDRATPPLQFYLAAPFVGLMGGTALAARLPFALCGLACVALILWWLHRDGASVLAWILTSLAILGNVSLFLFSRQCRYYGLAMLLSVAVAYTYLHVRTRRGLFVHAILSVLLLASNYMTFAAVSVMIAIDYLIWGRTRRALRGWDWAILLAPQVLIGAIIVWIWNPLRIAEPRAEDFSWIRWHATLLWWNLRDLVTCEFGVAGLLVAAPIVALLTRSSWLIRAILALLIGIVVISIISPQNPSNVRVADVRYVSFLIPLCIAVGVLTILSLAWISRIAAVVVACVAFGSNLLHFNWLSDEVPLRSTPYLYARELMNPVPEPFTPAAHWIGDNVKSGESVLVVPEHMMYPLMFHAPNAVYAWQLRDPPPAELAHLPPIHTALRLAPDYVILFGLHPRFVHRIPFAYAHVQNIPTPGRDFYRPELYWHRFEPLEQFDPVEQGIHIYKRVPPDSGFRL
jgi:hypothetical protein